MTSEQPGAGAEAPLPDPNKVVQDEDLSRSEKVQKLRRWRHDAHEIEVANDEGMGGTVQPSNLADVHEALRELGAPASPTSAPPASPPPSPRPAAD